MSANPMKTAQEIITHCRSICICSNEKPKITGSPVLLFSNSFIRTISFIEELTRVVIPYEIYETNLRRVSSISYEMTTGVRFFLSYDPLNGILSPSKWPCFLKEMDC